MCIRDRALGDEWAPAGAQTENFEEVGAAGGYEQHEETQPTALEEDASKLEAMSLDDKKLEDKQVKLEDKKVKLE
eukprot:7668427-Pyramimonas_sp.AAC.1